MLITVWEKVSSLTFSSESSLGDLEDGLHVGSFCESPADFRVETYSHTGRTWTKPALMILDFCQIFHIWTPLHSHYFLSRESGFPF